MVSIITNNAIDEWTVYFPFQIGIALVISGCAAQIEVKSHATKTLLERRKHLMSSEAFTSGGRCLDRWFRGSNN
jgi:hypothetical protein